MKEYFKYASGYININNTDLFLTNSGNWQETHNLKEKSPVSKRKNNLRLARINIFLYIVLGAIAAFIFYANRKYKIVLGLPVAGYFVLKYFRTEQGKRYRIPIAKIEKIERYESGLKIYFLNENNNSDFEIVDNVDARGIEFLTALKPSDAILA